MARRTGIGSRKTRSTARLGTAPQKRTGRARGATIAGRINWSKVTAAVLVLASLGLIYQLFVGQRFTVRHLVVRGNEMITKAEVEGASELLGRSIFHVHPEQAARTLTTRYGCIARAEVAALLPNQVIVEIKEHENLVVWQSGGAAWWVTSEGQSLGQAHQVGDLPVIHDLHAQESEPQGFIVGVPWTLVSDLLQELPDTRRLDYTREHGLIIYVTQGHWPVYLGSRGDAKLKLAIMTSVVEHLQNEGSTVDYIDLRSEREPAFKAHQSDR